MSLQRLQQLTRRKPYPEGEILAELDRYQPPEPLLSQLSQDARSAPWRSHELLSAGEARLTLFALAQGHVIPCHDHPGMHVFTRLLRGRLLLESYDLLGPQLGRPVRALQLSPGGSLLAVRPRQENLHRLEALSPCLFLDLFLPYYSLERPCHFYQPLPLPDGNVQLAQAPSPDLES